MNFNNHGKSCSHSCCLRIQNLSVRIGSETILKDVNMHIHCSELVALIGPNGAGKSTLLKAILGQQEYLVFCSRSKKPENQNRICSANACF